ncbi:MAG: nitronate monooxygenase, partial [Deltaproteobacteria bacterium]|nr:nitronate monooxygenase [Deltaproteobacteria bacterium]
GAVSRTAHYANRSQDVAFNAAGQVIGLLNQVRSTRDVIYTLVEEYFEAVERLQKLAP